jgi:hypothetical protein
VFVTVVDGIVAMVVTLKNDKSKYYDKKFVILLIHSFFLFVIVNERDVLRLTSKCGLKRSEKPLICLIAGNVAWNENDFLSNCIILCCCCCCCCCCC